VALLVLALVVIALILAVRARFSPVKLCRRCAGLGCKRCGGTGHRFRRGVSVAHRKQ
jgi:hypothetical protein